MAYQFFAKSSARSSNPPISPPPPARQTQPPLYPLPPQPPRSAAVSPRPTANVVSQASFTPYAGDLSASYATPHPHITIETIRTAHIPSLTRITGLLLPIRYPNSFYTNIITDPIVASLSRVAIYHDHPVAAAPNSNASSGSDKVIGGIRCRLERLDPDREVQGRVATNLYIQTLHLLSPYRGHGVAASLLNSLIWASPPDSQGNFQVSEIVKHYNIRSVTAHVHEANENGLRWYVARGFEVQEGVVEGYYRKLEPSGAKVVRLNVQWDEETDDQSPITEKKNASQRTGRSDHDDEEWEKVEAEDDEDDDHGVQLLGDSQVLDRKEMTPSRKRKAEEESGNKPQRR
ncbi:N-alpha-acetyltransferase 50 [Penicillium rolfsii]|nr:N-alpha-acetyltransferase 50 [Penicillium rolfsii]